MTDPEIDDRRRRAFGMLGRCHPAEAVGEGALTADDGGFVPLQDVIKSDAAMDAEHAELVALCARETLRRERQDFIDRAAIALMITASDPENTVNPEDDAAYVYDRAEALWAERERRRNA